MNYKELTKSSALMLVEFYATWCPHCQRMMPIVAQVKDLLNGTAEVVQLDIDKNPQAANEAGADSVPTFIIYKNGREMWRQSGEIDGEALRSKVLSYA